MSDPTPQTLVMERLYRWQAPVFDLTRGPVLLGRSRLAGALPAGSVPAGRPAGSCVIEVGCGTGHNLTALAAAAGPGATVIGIECAPAMARRAQRRVRALPGSGARVLTAEFLAAELPTAPCDALLFSYSLSMMPDYAAALARAEAILAPGGHVVVLDFAERPIAPIRWLMARSGVHVAALPDLWSRVRDRFDVVSEDVRRAYGGLWRYRCVVARRCGRSVQFSPGESCTPSS